MILKIIEEKNKYNKENLKNNLDIDKFSYRVICKDNKLYLVNANGYNCNITINNVNDILEFLNNTFNYITNISFLREHFNKINVFLLNYQEQTTLFVKLRNIKDMNLLYFKLIPDLDLFLSKSILRGYDVIPIVENIVYMVKAKNDYYIVSELRLSLFDSSNYKESSLINFSRLTCNSLAIENIDLSRMECLDYFFAYTTAKTIKLKNFDTSHITSMVEMFSNCLNLEDINLYCLNTHSVVDFKAMFTRCHNLKEIDLTKFDLTNAVNMKSMFESCDSLESVKIKGIIAPKLLTLGYCFKNCTKLVELDLSNCVLPVLYNMVGFVSGCINIERLDITGLVNSNLNGFKSISKVGWLDFCEKVKVIYNQLERI